MSSIDPRAAGEHFLDFSLAFYSLAQRQYRHANQIKANTKAFQAMMTLLDAKLTDQEPFTMSSLAEELRITKQQMTKLVNDLEDQGMVSRIHDSGNRRLVFIHISEKGRLMMEELKSQMLKSTVDAMALYTEEELAELDHCLQSMTRLLGKLDIRLPEHLEPPIG